MARRKKGRSSVNKKSPRKNPTPDMKKNLLRKNKNVCCVCKEHGLGLEFHHIDGNPSNTVEDNLAVLCVKDHDMEQRPHRYSKARHTDLSPKQIKRYKMFWEAFVEEASKPNTEILGFAILYGEGETVSALRLTFQWEDHVMWDKMIFVTDSPQHSWVDQMIESADWLGEYVQIVVASEIFPVDFCKKCESNGRYTRLDPVLYGSITKKYTDTDWDAGSYVSIYIDPYKPLLTFGVVLRDELVHGIYIYKQGKTVSTFCTEPLCKCHSSSFNEEISPENLKEQVGYILNSLLIKWGPARCNIFTFKDNASVLLNDITRKNDTPVLLDDITLHEAWYEDEVRDEVDEFNLPHWVKSIIEGYHRVSFV